MISARRTVIFAQSLVLLAVPHGAQHVARQNAWARMSADAARGRERREAQVAIDRASFDHQVRAAQ